MHVVALFLTDLFNQPLSSGEVLKSFKISSVIPLLKKSYKIFRLISDLQPRLQVMSKLLRHLVTHQLVSCLNENYLISQLQSAYCSGHSTKTAVLKALSDVVLAVDSITTAALTFLNLSAALDTLDRHITVYYSG